VASNLGGTSPPTRGRIPLAAAQLKVVCVLLLRTTTMRPCRHLTAAAFAFIPLAYSANVPFVIDSPTTASSTLVDVLSADPDFSILLTLLQRARLIPTLNRLNGSTLFAPTNEAIKRSQDGNSFWHTLAHEDASSFMRDNVHERLRQELFYHILNYTITEKDIYTTAKPRTHKTLHYPRQLTEPPGRPPNHPPWMPIPGGTLGGEPQRLRTILREEQGWAGVDSFGTGGARVAKALKPAANGVVVAIDDVLSVPSDLGTSSFCCASTCH
jgi:solute carrier family 25 carnitine/acylcarnitine transporter 20/29